jgi:hypothetical protein
MFFKNKETGLVWEVVHPDHIKRCKNDENYEEVKVEKKKVEKSKEVKTSEDKPKAKPKKKPAKSK